ncbi:uncharacterized protein A1O9_02004 [Exophiala aquamarina CBS 119918]|uniref:U4/U6.U5 small nuclear ribonucleoprotein 27kDa protein domain-containing protein n=1 Tax=Exophiala aquamarina CBS 119918 TaxID=1182545 RepID=A0A072PM79_9EURO|nr:uncharacterized protein A1O9_02004 [Exophiala aquamarina CBS 119918]KEF60443.1 hypothetical protein A1O9_02004 [Exophiala aquamarina CBS 119918]
MNHLQSEPGEQTWRPLWTETVVVHHDQVPAAEIQERNGSMRTIENQVEALGVMRVAGGDLGQNRAIKKTGNGSAADRESTHIETGTVIGTEGVMEVGEIEESMIEVTGTGAGVVIDHHSEWSHRHSRSRSPVKNGGGTPVRARSPPRRLDRDRVRPRGDQAKSEENPSKSAASPRPGQAQPAANGGAMAVDEDEDDAFLRRAMGFASFKSTHNTKVPGNQIYGVRKEKKTEYRQYMNRVGGFNRPLSPSRS